MISPRSKELAAAAVAFAVLTAVFTYPVSTRAGSVLFGDFPDFHLFVWTIGWVAHAIVAQPLAIFDANIFYPLGHTLAFSESLLGSGIMVAPVVWITGNHLLAVNLVSLLSVWLCGIGAFFLARRLGLSTPSAFICGVIFAFSPARFFRIGQLHLTTVQWMPFTLAFLHAYLQHGVARDLKVAVAFFALQAITTGHGAVFLTVAVVVLIVSEFAGGVRRGPVRMVKDLGITGALCVVPAVLVAVPYKIVQDEMGLRRTLENWAASGASYIASPAHVHRAILSLFVPATEVTEAANAFLFPGYLPLLLAAIAVMLLVAGQAPMAHRRHLRGYAALAVISVLLIAGPPISLWPLVYWLPGFNFIRVPSRFVILTVLTLAVLAAYAVEWIRKRVPAAGRRWVMPIAAALLLAEFSTIPIDVVEFSLRPAAAEQWLAEQPGRLVVAEVPNAGFPRDQSVYMLHSMAHWQKTVHGFSGFDPPEHYRMYATLRGFPEAASLDRLRAFGVTHVVVHVDRYSPDRWPSVDEALERADGLERVFQESRSRVYRLRYDPRTFNSQKRP